MLLLSCYHTMYHVNYWAFTHLNADKIKPKLFSFLGCFFAKLNVPTYLPNYLSILHRDHTVPAIPYWFLHDVLIKDRMTLCLSVCNILIRFTLTSIFICLFLHYVLVLLRWLSRIDLC